MSSVHKYSTILNNFRKREDFRKGVNLTDEQLEEKELCENSFLYFLRKAWPIVEGGSPFIGGWHIDAICEHLEALYRLEIQRLIINIPFRLAKSIICSVSLTPWVWTTSPNLQFLYSSYAQDLATRDSIRCRRLIQSDWYQSLWGGKFKLMPDVSHKLKFDNDQTGYRMITSVRGQGTGWGGHFEIEDDPNSVKQVESAIIRHDTNHWHDKVMSSRFSGILAEFRRLVVQQRTHESDVSGHILAKNDSRWVHLCLPEEFEKSRRCITIPLKSTNGKKWRDPRTKEGELIWPEGRDHKELHLIKTKDFNSDSYTIASQLQQRPLPAGGGILQDSWFKPWKQRDLPELDYILQSWDTALVSGKESYRTEDKSGRETCYSACTTWGIFKDKGGINNIILLSAFKGRLEYPDLRRMAVRLSNNYEDTYIDDPLPGRNPPDLVLIEAKVSGYSLLSEFMRLNIPVMRFDPGRHGNKEQRCRFVSHLIENGLVWLPTEPPNFEFYAEESQMFLEAAVSFPSDLNGTNDLIDSMSQAFIRFKSTGWVANKEDPRIETEPDWKTRERPYY